MKKRLFAAFTMLTLAMNFNASAFSQPMRASAEENVIVYDLNEADVFSRSKAEIAEERQAAYKTEGSFVSSNRTSYYVDGKVASNKSGSYEPGELTVDTIDIMSRVLNYNRSLAGLTGEVNVHPDPQLQKEALLRSFVGNFCHSSADFQFQKPDDMSQELWDDGSELTHNILTINTNADKTISSWFNEGFNDRTGAWDSNGHKHCLLYPSAESYDMGYSVNVGIGRLNIGGDTAFGAAAAVFPAAGYMPSNDVRGSVCSWTAVLDPDTVGFSDKEQVTVKITCPNGRILNRSSADNTLLCESYIEYSCINFVQPDDHNANGVFSGKYNVEISGLSDKATGSPAVIRYQVRFFDAENLECTNHEYISRVLRVPTCVMDGEISLTCRICEETKTIISGNASHKYTSEVIEPTAESEGYTLKVCSVCGQSEKTDIVPPVVICDNHNIRSEIVKAPTCLEKGEVHVYCTKCDFSQTKTIPMINHIYADRGDGNRSCRICEKTEYTDISTATVIYGKQYVFRGYRIELMPQVKIGSEVLEKDKDYILSYKNNNRPGVATMTVTGIGDYRGSVSYEYNLVPEMPKNIRIITDDNGVKKLTWDCASSYPDVCFNVRIFKDFDKKSLCAGKVTNSNSICLDDIEKEIGSGSYFAFVTAICNDDMSLRSGEGYGIIML